MVDTLFGIVSITCPVCEKSFERLSAEWVYRTASRTGYTYYCSYSCWCKALEERSHPKRERETFQLTPRERGLLNELLDEGRPVQEIARIFKVSDNCVYYYKKKREGNKKCERKQSEK